MIPGPENRRISLVAVVIVILTIIGATAAPPLAVLLVFAFWAQRRFRKKWRQAESLAIDKARADLAKAKALAAKSLS